jgi:hypothetical protein
MKAQPPGDEDASPSLVSGVVSVLGLGGAALAVLLGAVLAPGGMLLLSAGLAGCVGFFFALSSAGGSDALVVPNRPQGLLRGSGLRPSAVMVVNTALGLVLGVVLAAVAGGGAALLGQGTSTPGMGGGVVALGLGVTAHHLPGRLPWRMSAALAVTACLGVVAALWMGERMGVWAAPVMYLAVACTSYHALSALKTLRGATLSVAGLSTGALIAWLVPVGGAALGGFALVPAGQWLLAGIACGLLKPVALSSGEASHAA